MTTHGWIVYERSAGWSPALRTAFGRCAQVAVAPRIFEARRLVDVTARLCEQPASIVLLEVDRTTAPELLEWLANYVPRFPFSRFIALVKFKFACNTFERQDLVGALLEAGTWEIVFSPRQIGPILALAGRHAENATAAATSATDVSLRDWAWARLPWQPAEGRVG